MITDGLVRAIRSDLGWFLPSVPDRFFYDRGPLRFVQSSVPGGTQVIGAPPMPPENVGGGVTPPAQQYIAVQKQLISIAAATTSVIVPGVVGRSIVIFDITLTFGGEQDITLLDGSVAFSGIMPFAGTSEPRAIVMPQGGLAIRLQEGNDLRITTSTTALVAGFVTYAYME